MQYFFQIHFSGRILVSAKRRELAVYSWTYTSRWDFRGDSRIEFSVDWWQTLQRLTNSHRHEIECGKFQKHPEARVKVLRRTSHETNGQTEQMEFIITLSSDSTVRKLNLYLLTRLISFRRIERVRPWNKHRLKFAWKYLLFWIWFHELRSTLDLTVELYLFDSTEILI